MNKKPLKNPELTAESLSRFIFDTAQKDVYELEHNNHWGEVILERIRLVITTEKAPEIAEGLPIEFNKLPSLKRLLDLCIIYFWQVSKECQWIYEENDFQKICAMIEDRIYDRFEAYEKTNKILGVTLKEFVKDGKELATFYEECRIDGNTRVGFRALLSILFPMRFIDYNSTSVVDIHKRIEYFCQHAFGSTDTVYMFECLSTFPLIFSSISVSCPTSAN